MRRFRRLSNQWNVWWKEPNTNARVVPDFFPNEATLKQHHCEAQIKKEKFHHCNKTVIITIEIITWRSTWEVVRRLLHTLPNGNYVKWQWMDPYWRMDPQYLRNRWWRRCKLVVQLLLVVQHAEHWKAPEMVESALMYTALTFRKEFKSNNKRDLLQRLK